MGTDRIDQQGPAPVAVTVHPNLAGRHDAQEPRPPSDSSCEGDPRPNHPAAQASAVRTPGSVDKARLENHGDPLATRDQAWHMETDHATLIDCYSI